MHTGILREDTPQHLKETPVIQQNRERERIWQMWQNINSGSVQVQDLWVFCAILLQLLSVGGLPWVQWLGLIGKDPDAGRE